MKYIILAITSTFLSAPSFGCSACTIKASADLVRNFNAASGTSSGGTSSASSGGGKMIAAAKTKSAFKDSKIFDSVGNQEPDPNWKSSIE